MVSVIMVENLPVGCLEDGWWRGRINGGAMEEKKREEVLHGVFVKKNRMEMGYCLFYILKKHFLVEIDIKTL